MAATRPLDYLLNLIEHPSHENAKLTHLSLSQKWDVDLINDIKSGGEKVLKLMKNLAAFPNLKEIDARFLLGELEAYELTSYEESRKQKKQALVSHLLCTGISASPSLKKMTLIAINPLYFQEILDSISKSQSIIHLDLTGCFPADRWLVGADLRRISQVVNFLQVNTRIHALESDRTETFTLKFVEAIASNPHTAIKTIDITGSGHFNGMAKQINQLCKQKGISVTVRDGLVDLSHIALCDDLAAKMTHTGEERKLLESENQIVRSLKTQVMTIQDVVSDGSVFQNDGLTYLIMRFAYLIKSDADLKFVMQKIPEEHRVLVCERFLTDHIAKHTGDVSKWEIPELQAAISQRKQLQTTLDECVPITPLQSIILSYTSTLFCPRERIVGAYKQDKEKDIELRPKQ